LSEEIRPRLWAASAAIQEDSMTGASKHLCHESEELLLRVVQIYLRRRCQGITSGPVVLAYWEDFYRRYAPRVAGMLARYFSNRIERDDAFQEVWLTLTTKLPEFQWQHGSRGFPGWLAKLIYHKAVDLIRRKQRYSAAVLSELVATQWKTLEADCGLGQPWERRSLGHQVQIIVADLQPRIHTVNFSILQLHYWQGLSVPQIAARLGLTPGQVWSRLHRVLQKLRPALARHWSDESRGSFYFKKARKAQPV
jgi:RNA polymerase sigma-70 factor (ECF subfamily)